MTQSDYEKCLAEMYCLRRFGIKLGLDIIDRMLEGLGRPEKNFSCIHVAGTNGKGSIASAMAAVLNNAGYRVGLFTSPHLVRFNERICINGSQISDRAVVEAYRAVKQAFPADREPTFFEYCTAMALYAFAQARVDWAVMETGMGGRLDATNIISPELCIISNISLEHREYLGNTIARIAAEKGGIIKQDTPVVTGVHQKSAVRVIQDIALEKRAPLYRRGRDFRIRRGRGGREFAYYGLDHKWTGIRHSLLGLHQLDNAALVLAGCELLMGRKAVLAPENIRKGLAGVSWPGRLEILDTRPEVIIDGAHNLAAAGRLASFLRDYAGDRKITMVIGILDDKPFQAMLKILLPLCARVIVTRARTQRAIPVRTLARTAEQFNESIEIIEDVGQAVARAMQTAEDGGLVCIAGSLYVAGEAKAAIEGSPAPEPV